MFILINNCNLVIVLIINIGHFTSSQYELSWLQERVYDLHSESDKQTASPEVVSLIPAPPSPAHCAVDHHATPSDGVDNPNLKTG